MADCDAVSRLLGEVDAQHVRLRPDVFQPFDDADAMRERVTGFVDNDDAEVLVAEMDGRIVGVASAQIHDNPGAPMFRPGRRAIMSDLVVEPEFRRSGIAKELLARVAEWSRSRGFKSLGINVWSANEEGLAFFIASGFTPRCQQMEMKIEPTQ